MEKMNKGKMPAEIGKLFGLLYDGESELLVRIASENLKKPGLTQNQNLRGHHADSFFPDAAIVQ